MSLYLEHNKSSQNVLGVSSIFVIICSSIILHVLRDTYKNVRRGAAGDVSNTALRGVLLGVF
jgi:hypothetical protein